MLTAGVTAAMLVALTLKVFELDRYFVPKELVVNIAALIVAMMFVARRRVLQFDTADLLLTFYLAWSAASLVFASNYWLAQRAFSLSLASALIFWAARRAGIGGLQRFLFIAAASAAVIAAVTSLAQAYGIESEFFTLARAPGGTLGNRNFVAHIVAIGLPVTVWCTVAARRSPGALAGSAATGLLTVALILSRSRAAWLASIMFVAVSVVLLLASRRYWRGGVVGGRLARVLLAMATGGLVAVALPNQLDWNSDSPYLDSAKKVVDYSSGSGRGRIAQYQNSLKMSLSDPIFGTGPGNWPVRYPKFAPGGDKSLVSSGMTANPWPSSDWVAFVSERGIIATLALAGMFAAIFFRALRGWKEHDSGETVLMNIAVAGTVVCVIVVSAFDAVLLLPAPAFLAWMILGAGSGPRRGGRPVDLSSKSWSLGAMALVLACAVGVTRSSAEVKAMWEVGTGAHRAGWVSGAAWDPGSYRINERVAELYANRGECGTSKVYARRALDLFPYSPQARRTARRCGVKTGK